ncbi:MAG: HEAT repeat domain-containing protein [Verrucomicrobiae bacterium]|nr:HEAT repeat domain-containing protein [Verrucomicrobiae bacterium]
MDPPRAPHGPAVVTSVKPFLFRLLVFVAALALRAAAVELSYPNEATRDLLLQALDDRDRVQRIRTVEALAAADDPRNEAPLASVARKDAVAAVRAQADPNEAPRPDNTVFVPRDAPNSAAFTFTALDPRLRTAARLKALREDAAFARDFRLLLEDPDYFVRRAVSEEAVRLRGISAAPQWRELFASTNTDLRVEAAWASGQLRDAAAEAPLLECLASPSERLRLLAISALAAVGSEATRAALPAALDRSEGKMREELIRLAMSLKAGSALPNLRAIAGDKTLPQPARALALDALGALVDAAAKDVVLANLRNFAFDTALLREHAASACAALGLAEALPTLRKLACDKPINIPMVGPSYDSDATRIACVAAMARLGGAAAIQPVVAHACLEESSEDVRKAVADAMTSATGIPYAWRRSVSFRPSFLLSLAPEELPPDLAANQKMPPVFPASAVSR